MNHVQGRLLACTLSSTAVVYASTVFAETDSSIAEHFKEAIGPLTIQRMCEHNPMISDRERVAYLSARRRYEEAARLFESKGFRAACTSVYDAIKCNKEGARQEFSKELSTYSRTLRAATPYEAIFEGDGPCGSTFKAFRLMPAEEIADSIEAESELRTLLTSGSLAYCSETKCSKIVRLESGDGDECLAACSVMVIGNEHGAPEHCIEMLHSKGGETSLLAHIGMSEVECARGLPDYDFVVIVPYGASSSGFLAAVQRVLTRPPFALSAEVHGASVFGTSQYRFSDILGARSLITVRVDIYGRFSAPTYGAWGTIRSQDPRSTSLHIQVATTIYVNEQNTSTPLDYHLPNPIQENRFVQAIKDALTKELERTCTRHAWQDTRTLLCPITRGDRLVNQPAVVVSP